MSARSANAKETAAASVKFLSARSVVPIVRTGLDPATY